MPSPAPLLMMLRSLRGKKAAVKSAGDEAQFIKEFGEATNDAERELAKLRFQQGAVPKPPSLATRFLLTPFKWLAGPLGLGFLIIWGQDVVNTIVRPELQYGSKVPDWVPSWVPILGRNQGKSPGQIGTEESANPQARQQAEITDPAGVRAKLDAVALGEQTILDRITSTGQSLQGDGKAQFRSVSPDLMQLLDNGYSLPTTYESLKSSNPRWAFLDNPERALTGSFKPVLLANGRAAAILIPAPMDINGKIIGPAQKYVLIKFDDGTGGAIPEAQWDAIVQQANSRPATPGPSASLGTSFSGGSGVDQLRGGAGNDHVINSSISVPNATASFAALPQTDGLGLGLGLPLSLAFMAGIGAAYNIGKRSTRPGSSGRVPTGDANKAAQFGVDAAEGAAKGLEMTGKAKAGLTWLKFAGKKIPLAGALICFGFGATETAKHLSRGHLGLAGVAAANTAVDTVFGLGGFVTGFAGDAIHESIRLTAIKVGGNEFRALHHSGSGEIANMVGQGFQSATRPTSVARGGPSATLEHA